MKRILSILSVIAMIITMLAAITLPAVAETAPFTSIYEEHETSGIWTSAGTVPDGRSTYRSAKKITVAAGDKLYFGPCRTNQGGHLYLWTDENKAPLVGNTSDALELADVFDNGDVLYCYTAPQAGEVGIVCYTTYIDSFVITKNEPVTAENFFEYWEAQNSSMDLSRYSTAPKLSENEFSAVDIGYYNADGTIKSSSNYYYTDPINVKAGDVVYFGPYDLTTSQGSYLYDWHGAEGFTDYTKLLKELALDSPRTHIAATFPNGQVIFAYEVAKDGRIGIYTRTDYGKMFFVSKNVRITEENFYEYWDFHSNKCGDYSAILGRYDNVVAKESVLNGKTALFVGDSLCAAAADDNFFNDYKGMDVPGWAGRLALYYGLKKAVNNGVSGAALSNTRDRWYNTTSSGKKQGRIYWQITSEANYKYDYILLEGGGNDGWDSAPIGEMSDSFEFEDFDLSTYAGGLEATIYQTIKYHPEAAIGYMTLYQTPFREEGSLRDMTAYFEMGEKICEKWNIPVLPIHRILTAETFDTKVYTHDNIHAVAAGYDVLTSYIAPFMESLKPYSEVKKTTDKTIIACVGDSLTKGTDSGDVIHSSYPAFLQEMMGDEYEVYNFGSGGAAAQQINEDRSYRHTSHYKRSMLSTPDQVIVMLGANDSAVAWDSEDHAASCAAFKQNLKEIVEGYMALPSKPTVHLATPTYLNKDEYRTIYTDGGLLKTVEELAAELGITFINTYEATNGCNDLLAEDNVHYTAEGYKLIASTIYKGITGKEAPAIVPITEQDPAVEETNQERPLIRNWKQYYDTVDAFRIETVEDVEIFGDLIAAGITFAGKTVYLENDLDFDGLRFKPLGASSAAEPKEYTRAFQGTFDGQYHVFSNVNITDYKFSYMGLFPVLCGATIKNFGLDGGRVEGHNYVGAITGCGDHACQFINVWSSADVYGTSIVGGIAAYMRKNSEPTSPKMVNVACYGTISAQDTLYGISAWGQTSSLHTENLVFGGTLDLHTKTNASSPFVRYGGTELTGVATGYYTTEVAEMKTVYVSDVETVRFSKQAFTTYEFPYYMNNLEGNTTKWTLAYGYAIPWGTEEEEFRKISIDNKVSYTDGDGHIPADILATGSYWYGTDGKCYTAATAATWVLEEGASIKIGISAAGADFDADGAVTTADVVMLLRYVDHKDETITATHADVNADGKIVVYDAVRLLQVINDIAEI